MNTWLKVASCAVVGLLIFGAGYKYAAALYSRGRKAPDFSQGI